MHLSHNIAKIDVSNAGLNVESKTIRMTPRWRKRIHFYVFQYLFLDIVVLNQSFHILARIIFSTIFTQRFSLRVKGILKVNCFLINLE